MAISSIASMPKLATTGLTGCPWHNHEAVYKYCRCRRNTPKVWKRHVDDSFCIIKRNAVDSFHNTLNSIDQHISFTIEEENNNQIAFLDALVSRKDNVLIVDVYRKPTHTDRYLDFFSHHDKRHKAETLIYRATNLPNRRNKEKRLNLFVSPTFFESIITPKMLFLTS